MQRMWSTYLEPTGESTEGGDDAGAGAVTSRRRFMDYTPPRRASSTMSHTNSLASSQQHILRDHNPNVVVSIPAASAATNLETIPPSPRGSYYSSTSPNPVLTENERANGVSTSLSVNFIPSKFTRPVSPGLHKRKSTKDGKEMLGLPKRGGGRQAFRSGEARMPGENDDDYDGVDVQNVRQTIFGIAGLRKPRGLRWNRFKWILFFANCVFSAYSIVALIVCLLTWFNIWDHADVVRVGNRSELVVSTLAATMGIVTSLIGWAGILLNNRAFLAVYNLFIWVTFAMICAPGYLTYKRRAFNLEGKVNSQWSKGIGVEGRLRIQNELDCCGYFSPFVEATVSQTCYARSNLPGCKPAYIKFEQMVLERWYTVAFSIVPAHIVIIFVALLCSNHVTYRFGKGMMPKAYRLSMNSMAVIMDNYASQLAEQYGSETATELIARSRSNFNLSGSQLDGMAPLPYTSGGGSGGETPPPAFAPSPASGGGQQQLYNGQYSALDRTASDDYSSSSKKL